jgi:hypothetical protein
MLMPLGESHPSSWVLLDLLGVGGFDTWTPGLTQTELPNTITDVIHLGPADQPDTSAGLPCHLPRVTAVILHVGCRIVASVGELPPDWFPVVR